MQRGGPLFGTHRCFVLYTILGFCSFLVPSGYAEVGDKLEDFAEVYIDQYFEPDERLLLTEEGKKKSQALAHYAMGRTFEAKGRVNEAVKAYGKVLENQPHLVLLARKTAYLLARDGSNDKALKLLEQSLKKNPNDAFAYISLSEYLATYQGNDPKGRARAFEIIEAAVDRFPDEPAVYEHIVRMMLVAKRKDEARVIVDRAAKRNNIDSEYWLRLGKIVGRTWPVRPNVPSIDAELLNRIYGKAREFAGEDWATVELVGDFYHATQQFVEAVRTYNEVIESNPDHLDTREKLARVYAGLDDREMVLKTLEEIVEIDPRNAGVHKQIAGFYIGIEDYASAVPHLQQSLLISKGEEREYVALGGMMIDAKQYEAAVEFLDGAAYLFPESSQLPLFLAISYSSLEDWGNAVTQFATSLKLGEASQPEMFDEVFYFRYAAAYERKGDLKEAEDLFQKTIELISKKDPSEEDKEFTATVYNYLGYMWLEKDMNIDEAGELIRTAADLDPDSGAIADSLGWFYFKKERYEEARDELLRAEELTSEPAAEILDHIGRAFHKLGENGKAVGYLERALELEPENTEIAERLEYFRKSEVGKPDRAAKPGNKSAELQNKRKSAEPVLSQ